MGVDRSTYCRLKKKLDRWGIDALRIRERRRPRMPNAIGPHLEQRIIAFCLGHPGHGPRRIAAELAREKWGGIRLSEHGVWRVLRRVGLNTRSRRLALIARDQDRYERKPALPPPERHIEASEPGQKVQLDCFYVGRLSGTEGTVWQYTAIDVASAFAGAEFRTSERNPRARHTRELLHRVARELRAGGWQLKQIGTDTAPSFARASLGTPWTSSGPVSVSSRPAGPARTAASSVSSSPSSRSAGDPPSPARSCPR
jgi:homeodomain-containing protein